jgi:hypothetical protein
MQVITAISKELTRNGTLLSRQGTTGSSPAARELAARIGRVFTRFPFPDEVNPAFKKLREKARRKAGTESAFGKVLDLIEVIRVSADQWENPGRRLILHVIIPSYLLIQNEDADPDWAWGPASVVGAKNGEKLENLSLTRVSELLLANCEAAKLDPKLANLSTILYLWQAWESKIEIELLRPGISPEIEYFGINLVSDSEFSYAQWKTSESLDLEVLSDSVKR